MRISDWSSDVCSSDLIEPGAVIKADTSVETLRLMDTLSSAQRLLVALDPASMDTAISQLAQALDGRGADLAAFFDDANHLLGTFSETEYLFYQDLDLPHDHHGLPERSGQLREGKRGDRT